MILDLLASESNLAVDLLERTASTARVQQIVQISLAPAFLLAGIGAIMNVMTNRLIWVANRIERIHELEEDGRAGQAVIDDLPALEMRRTYAQRAVMFSTGAAVTISLVIALLFISAFIKPQIGTVTAVAWIAAMVFLITGLMFFWLETRTAARRNRERQRKRIAEERLID